MRAIRLLPLVVGIVLLAGSALASTPDSSGVIHGCYVKTSGALRISEGKCKATELPIWWRQSDPAPAPPAGTLSGLEMVVGSLDPNASSTNETTVTCPSGKVAIAGAGYLGSDPLLVQIADSSTFRSSVEVDWSSFTLTPASRVSWSITCGYVS